MVEYRMRLAWQTPPHADRRGRCDETVRIGTRHRCRHHSGAAQSADDLLGFGERSFERAGSYLGVGTVPSRVRDSVLHYGVDSVEDQPEHIAPPPRHEPRMMSAGSPVGALRHAKSFLHTAHRYRDVAGDFSESRTVK
jgi:hypothetical protein